MNLFATRNEDWRTRPRDSLDHYCYGIPQTDALIVRAYANNSRVPVSKLRRRLKLRIYRTHNTDYGLWYHPDNLSNVPKRFPDSRRPDPFE